MAEVKKYFGEENDYLIYPIDLYFAHSENGVYRFYIFAEDTFTVVTRDNGHFIFQTNLYDVMEMNYDKGNNRLFNRTLKLTFSIGESVTLDSVVDTRDRNVEFYGNLIDEIYKTC